MTKLTHEQQLSMARGMLGQWERVLYQNQVEANSFGVAHAEKRIAQWSAEVARLEAPVVSIDSESLARAREDISAVARHCGWEN